MSGLSHVVAEVDSAGVVTALYVRAGDMLLEEVRGGVAKMYEADGLGSTRSLLDTSGAQTDTWSYEAFGTTVSETGTSVNPYRFAGERFVEAAGMYQNRARWLDTGTGRFVSVDPANGQIRRPATLHGYIYAGAGPVSSSDATGRFFTMTGAMVVVLSQSAMTASVGGGAVARTPERSVLPPTKGELAEDRSVQRELVSAMIDSIINESAAADSETCLATYGWGKECCERVKTKFPSEEGGWIYATPGIKGVYKFRRLEKHVRQPDGINLSGPPDLFASEGVILVGEFHTHPNRWVPWAGTLGAPPSPQDDEVARARGIPGVVMGFDYQYYPYGALRREGWEGSSIWPGRPN